MHFSVLLFLTNLVFVYGIMGGYDIKIYHAPYQVNYGDVCGGAVIHKKWALTSAHCGTNHTYIRIGSSYRLGGPKVNITTHHIHPMFGLEHKFDFDVQLLETLRSLRVGHMIAPIPISTGKCGKEVYVAGWGYPAEKGDYQNILHQVKIKTMPLNECQKIENTWYKHTLTPRMFCAGGWGQDACQGDSGGAAVSFGKLVGISSFGFGCGRKIPGVYTNISDSNIRKWIKHYTGV